MKRLRPSLVLLTALIGCSVTPDDAAYSSSVSAACDACLTGDGEAGLHCAAELDSCDDDPICEQYVLCQLRSGCYSSPSSGACEQRAGCTPPDPFEPASAFERCARTTCADVCRFSA